MQRPAAEDNPNPTHTLKISEFDSLAAGRETPAIAAKLDAGVYSTRKLLLRHVVSQSYADDAPEILRQDQDDTAWDILDRAQENAPDVIRDILLEPSTGGWLYHTVRLLNHQGESKPGAPLWAHKGFIGSIAVVAAMKANVPANVYVPTYDGVTMFPTLGRARLSDTTAYGIARVEVSPHTPSLRLHGRENVIEVADIHTETPFWQPCCFLKGETPADRLLLDDLNPYRALDRPLAFNEVTRSDVETIDQWKALYRSARAMLATDHPQLAEETARMRNIVPRGSAPRFTQLSSSNTQQPLSAQIALPENPKLLALSLVHEYYHSKLDKALTAYTLFVSDEAWLNEILYSGWRDDPRPLRGHLHGTYASLGIATFWMERSAIDTGDAQRLAQFEFALWQRKLSTATQQLSNVMEGLTDLGQRFARGLIKEIATLQSEAPPPDVDALAQLVATSHEALWRAYHVLPPPKVARQADHPRRQLDKKIKADPNAQHLGVTAVLARFMLANPTEFAAARQNPEAMRAAIPAATPADTALIAGNLETAGQLYHERLRVVPDDPLAIVGIGLIENAINPGPISKLLLHSPQAVRAVIRNANEPLAPIEAAKMLLNLKF